MMAPLRNVVRWRQPGMFDFRSGGRLVVALVILGLFPLRGDAHQLSDSFLVLEVTNGQIAGHWDIAVKDLLHARGVDPNTNNISWDPEDEMKRPEIFSRLSIGIDGAASPVKPVDYSTELYPDGPYAVMYFEIALPDHAKMLEVQYLLFSETNSAHRGLMRLQDGVKTLTAVFGPGQTTQQFDLRHLSAVERIMDFVRLGVWHIWSGIDHILFLLALLLPSVWRWEGGRWQSQTSFRATVISVLKIVTADRKSVV